MSIPNVNLKHQHRTVVQHIADPSQALNAVLQDNVILKANEQKKDEQIAYLTGLISPMQGRLQALEEFSQIIDKPIPELSLTLKDKFIIDILRGMMVKIWGPGGELDMQGGFAQTAVNRKLELLVTEIIRFAKEHFHQIPGRIRIAEGVVPDGTEGLAQVGNPGTH